MKPGPWVIRPSKSWAEANIYKTCNKRLEVLELSAVGTRVQIPVDLSEERAGALLPLELPAVSDRVPFLIV